MKVNCFSARLAVAVLLWISYAGQSVNAASDHLMLAENNKTVVIIQTDEDSRNQQDNNRRIHQNNQDNRDNRDNYDDKQREHDRFPRNNHQDKSYRQDDDRYRKDRPQYQQYRKHQDNYEHRPHHRKRHTR